VEPAAAADPPERTNALDELVGIARRAWNETDGSRTAKARAVLAAIRERFGSLRRAVQAAAASTADEPGLSPAEQAVLRAVDEPVEPEAPPVPPDAPPVDPAPEPAAGPDRIDEYVAEAKADTTAREQELATAQRTIARFSRLVLVLLVVAGAATILLAVIGVALAFSGSVAVGVVSTGIAIFPAAGTALLFKLEQTLSGRRQELVRERDHNRSELATVQAINAIDDPAERRRAFREFADDLKKRRFAAA
jgi:hypothetical protein